MTDKGGHNCTYWKDTNFLFTAFYALVLSRISNFPASLLFDLPALPTLHFRHAVLKVLPIKKYYL
jgi:hypothetical protein